jgi:hypothetical protein
MKLDCCWCGLEVEVGQPDTYTIQLSEPALTGVPKSPGRMWAHGSCLRDAIPLLKKTLN